MFLDGLEDNFSVGNVLVACEAGVSNMSFVKTDAYSMLYQLQRPLKTDENDNIFHQYCTELFKTSCYHLALFNLSTSETAFALSAIALNIDQDIQSKVLVLLYFSTHIFTLDC